MLRNDTHTNSTLAHLSQEETVQKRQPSKNLQNKLLVTKYKIVGFDFNFTIGALTFQIFVQRAISTTPHFRDGY